jgi:spore coat protein CotH
MGRRTGRILLLAILVAAGCGDPKSGTDGHGLFPVNAQAGLNPFDDNALTTYRLTMDPADWDAIVANPQDNTWRRTTLDWQGETWYDVAIRPAGQRARVAGNPKPTFRLKFNYYVPHRKFHDRFLTGVRMGSDTLDPSMIRRRLENGIYRASGLPAPRNVSARVSVNGVYKGVFGVEERIKRSFIKEHFGSDVMEQLYDFMHDPSADVTWSGPDPSLYVPPMFIPKLRKLDPAHPELKVADPASVRDFVDVVNNAPWASAAAAADVDMFLRFMAAEVVTGEADAYVATGLGGPGSRSSNFRIYPNPRTGRWIVLAWDREEGYWATRDSIITGFDQRVLTRQLILQDPATLDRFKAVLRQLVSGAASVDSIDAQVEFLRSQLQDAVAEDPYKTAGTLDSWRDHLQTIRTFARQQNAMIQSQLQ